ncbi:hypothetical protein Pyn_35555 [Prunus yedoensis var. nudiflora]|uniref:Cupin-like domain-containing protein n=1 Tax=Prunus yedoensis var. nudiflora TaxID=2094558 RepID=A0A314XWI6_PRUYE|nr:hypothetical protein Pyn_35555 [Prunus yedoensis var. nudiflora]
MLVLEVLLISYCNPALPLIPDTRSKDNRTSSMEEIETLWKEVRELSLGDSGRVDHLEFPPNPLQFLRDFVCQNKPCIISNATLHWPALSSWTQDSYLTGALSSADVSLHLTPHGQADALVPLDGSLCFSSAHVQRMPFPEALSLITNNESPSKLVAYAQQQNNCFLSEYSALAADCDPISHGPVRPLAASLMQSTCGLATICRQHHFIRTTMKISTLW